MVKLTKRAVEAAEAKTKDYILWDRELPGFGLRVFPSGKRSYIVQYRQSGRSRRMAIGLHGVWTAELARREAKAQLGRVAAGDDPAEERLEDHQAMTMKQLCERYGSAMDRDERGFAGCVPILGTAFLLRVPIITKRPGTPGETIWICYPDKIEDDEDALEWLEQGPNIGSLPKGDGLKARRLANEVATLLRGIRVNLATVEKTDSRVWQLRDQILNHLEGAAEKIVRGKPEDLKHAQWDMQMACELRGHEAQEGFTLSSPSSRG